MKIKKVCRIIVWIWKTFTVQISVQKNCLLKSQTARCCLNLVGAQYQQLRWIYFHLFYHTEMTFVVGNCRFWAKNFFHHKWTITFILFLSLLIYDIIISGFHSSCMRALRSFDFLRSFGSWIG